MKAKKQKKPTKRRGKRRHSAKPKDPWRRYLKFDDTPPVETETQKSIHEDTSSCISSRFIQDENTKQANRIAKLDTPHENESEREDLQWTDERSDSEEDVDVVTAHVPSSDRAEQDNRAEPMSSLPEDSDNNQNPKSKDLTCQHRATKKLKNGKNQCTNPSNLNIASHAVPSTSRLSAHTVTENAESVETFDILNNSLQNQEGSGQRKNENDLPIDECLFNVKHPNEEIANDMEQKTIKQRLNKPHVDLENCKELLQASAFNLVDGNFKKHSKKRTTSGMKLKGGKQGIQGSRDPDGRQLRSAAHDQVGGKNFGSQLSRMKNADDGIEKVISIVNEKEAKQTPASVAKMTTSTAKKINSEFTAMGETVENRWQVSLQSSTFKGKRTFVDKATRNEDGQIGSDLRRSARIESKSKQYTINCAGQSIGKKSPRRAMSTQKPTPELQPGRIIRGHAGSSFVPPVEAGLNHFKCGLCKKVTTCVRTSQMHHISHTGYIYGCLRCKRKFVIEENAVKHVIAQHLIKGKHGKVGCCFCTTKFDIGKHGKVILYEHISRFHSDRLSLFL